MKKSIREAFDLRAAMKAEEKEWASRTAQTPKFWKCYVCRKEETWRDGWRCYNSMLGQEAGEPLIVTCSDACRKTHTDEQWEQALFRMFDETGYVEPPPQNGMYRMYPERVRVAKKEKLERKKLNKFLFTEPAGDIPMDGKYHG